MPIKVDVRVIAATNQNLEQRVEEGHFREDLLHRLNVIRVHVPPMRERREDIISLVEHFLTTAAKELHIERKNLSHETEEFLIKLDWPGNVRQVGNFCRWVTVMASGREIFVDDLPAELKKSTKIYDASSDWESGLSEWAKFNLMQGGANLLNEALPKFERIMIEAALKQTGGRRQEAAKLLGWGRNTLTRKIKELDLK